VVNANNITVQSPNLLTRLRTRLGCLQEYTKKRLRTSIPNTFGLEFLWSIKPDTTKVKQNSITGLGVPASNPKEIVKLPFSFHMEQNNSILRMDSVIVGQEFVISRAILEYCTGSTTWYWGKSIFSWQCIVAFRHGEVIDQSFLLDLGSSLSSLVDLIQDPKLNDSISFDVSDVGMTRFV
jgi:hypothetical protein